MQDPNFSYGLVTDIGHIRAKDVIAPDMPLEENPENKELYIKTHGCVLVGEQKDRKYDWNFNPRDHIFGKSKPIEENQTKKCIQSDFTEALFPKTRLVVKNVEDYRNFMKDPIGKVKNIGQTVVSHISSDHCFGYKPKNHDEWDASKCIRGAPNTRNVDVDPDLGQTNRFGFRKTPKPGDENRVFGVPTIRNDVMPPKKKSVADPNNYGDEVDAIRLLSPDMFSNMGLTQ